MLIILIFTLTNYLNEPTCTIVSIVFNDPDIRLLVLINESMGVLNKQKRGGEIPLFFWQKSYKVSTGIWTRI